uniref:Uncharacterized protein n=1 Tax=Oryza glumipatula TaxID=40148 RepID=A0A0E0A915_9ORYZ
MGELQDGSAAAAAAAFTFAVAAAGSDSAFLHGTTARDDAPCFPAPAAADDTRLAARCSRRVHVLISAATACRRLAPPAITLRSLAAAVVAFSLLASSLICEAFPFAGFPFCFGGGGFD